MGLNSLNLFLHTPSPFSSTQNISNKMQLSVDVLNILLCNSINQPAMGCLCTTLIIKVNFTNLGGKCIIMLSGDDPIIWVMATSVLHLEQVDLTCANKF